MPRCVVGLGEVVVWRYPSPAEGRAHVFGRGGGIHFVVVVVGVREHAVVPLDVEAEDDDLAEGATLVVVHVHEVDFRVDLVVNATHLVP